MSSKPKTTKNIIWKFKVSTTICVIIFEKNVWRNLINKNLHMIVIKIFIYNKQQTFLKQFKTDAVLFGCLSTDHLNVLIVKMFFIFHKIKLYCHVD